MKNFFDKLKNSFGMGEEEGQSTAVPATETTTNVPAEPVKDDHARYLPGYTDPVSTVQGTVTPSMKSDSPSPAVLSPGAANAAEPAANAVKASPKKSWYPETAQRREEIISFIINALKPYVDESGIVITGLRLYIVCADNAEQETARIALYADKPGYLRTEKLERKLQNNFIQLADNWGFSYELVKELPDCIFKKDKLGLDVILNQHTREHRVLATLRVLTGQTASTEYVLDSSANKPYHIGRGFQPQLSSGKLHTNDIVFLNREDPGFDEHLGKQNLYVSRDHAIIAFNPAFNRFLLYADKGGLPESGNKTKIFKTSNKIERVDIAEIGHELRNGDQIELGGGAKLLFIEQG